MDIKIVRDFCKHEVTVNKTASSQICAPVNHVLSQSEQKQSQCEQKQGQLQEQKQEQKQFMGFGFGIGSALALLIGSVVGYTCHRLGRKKGMKKANSQPSKCQQKPKKQKNTYQSTVSSWPCT